MAAICVAKGLYVAFSACQLLHEKNFLLQSACAGAVSCVFYHMLNRPCVSGHRRRTYVSHQPPLVPTTSDCLSQPRTQPRPCVPGRCCLSSSLSLNPSRYHNRGRRPPIETKPRKKKRTRSRLPFSPDDERAKRRVGSWLAELFPFSVCPRAPRSNARPREG